MNVRRFMTGEPVTCEADDSLGDAASLMDKHDVGCVVVLSDRQLAGLVTDRQVAMALGSLDHEASDSVGAVMTESPATVGLEANVFEVLAAMRGASLPKRIPVVDGDKLVGLVSIDDIAVIADELNEEVFRNYTHVSLEETKVPTGAKRMSQRLRSPGETDTREPEDLEDPITVPHTQRAHERKST